MQKRNTFVAAALALNLLAVGWIAYRVVHDRTELRGRLAAQEAEIEALQKRLGGGVSSATEASAVRGGGLAAEVEGLKSRLANLEHLDLPHVAIEVDSLTEGLAKLRGVVSAAQHEAEAARAECAGTKAALSESGKALEGVRKELGLVRARVDRRVVEAEAFHLVDEKGQRLAALSSGATGAALVVFDKQRHDQERVRIGAQTGGSTYGMVLRSGGDTPVSSLLVERDQGHLMLSENKASGGQFDFTFTARHPRLEVRDTENRACLMMGIDNEGAYTDLYTAEGSKVISLGVGKEAWGLTLTDDKSRAGIMANMVSHKPILTTINAVGRPVQDSPEQK